MLFDAANDFDRTDVGTGKSFQQTDREKALFSPASNRSAAEEFIKSAHPIKADMMDLVATVNEIKDPGVRQSITEEMERDVGKNPPELVGVDIHALREHLGAKCSKPAPPAGKVTKLFSMIFPGLR